MIEERERRRRMNADRVRQFRTDEERVIALICECGDSACSETVLLTGPQFEAQLAAGESVVHPRHIGVAHGHWQ